ncbi:NlpC/P60 family protein [Actinomycetospora soli]|uniref:NlpC/P60 family protein n=1 Tax=Actinomycetospora soli TaxID=2893887 RepID=UPI001E516F06|nr:NlpC/P60 family protein [Actinomycetospora soli]MCD2187585.1 NlpC/P60 family protein [Actinomycetospora soli]
MRAAVLAGVLLLALATPALAQTPPPPGDPGGPAAEVGRLVGQLSTLQTRLDDLADTAGHRRELANRAVADETAAQARVTRARAEATAARGEADRVAGEAEAARAQVDAWVAAQFQQADASSIAAALAGTNGPNDVAERLQLQGLVSAEQTAALDGYEQKRVDAANADSRARKAAADAQAAADTARDAADAARDQLAAARSAVAAQQQRIATVTAQRTAAQARLATLEASDAALAAQRRRAEAAQAARDRAQSASDAAARAAAQQRLATAAPKPAATTPDPDPPSGTGTPTPAPGAPADPVEIVIDRALSELGTTYAWGGGDADGPTRGIRDGGVADAFGDFDKVGFDCSGLMIYAFAGVGKQLPHYSGYQADAGPKVPLAERRPGDMLFWADGDGIHHVALYLGDDRMVEAPQSGKVVRVTAVRFDDEILPTVTRLL